MTENPWRLLSSRVAYENAWIRVREDSVLRPDGKPGLYGVVEIRPSVGIVAVNGRDEVALVRQWRYPLNRFSWEIPRGGSHPGETDMLITAQRELAEEAGVKAAAWQKLGTLDVNNGVTNDVQTIFLATGLDASLAALDPEEDIIVAWKPFSEVLLMIARGDITEVCSVAALFMVKNQREARE